jgi:hypothetical protein
VVTFMGLIGLNLQSVLKLKHVLTALSNHSNGVVLSTPTVVLREFAHHVRQNEHLSDCAHLASLLLEQPSDVKAPFGEGGGFEGRLCHSCSADCYGRFRCRVAGYYR